LSRIRSAVTSRSNCANDSRIFSVTNGVLHTIETITPTGDKRYLAGGAEAGNFCAIGGPLKTAKELLVCEGWTTAASLFEATGLPVIAAMDAGNLGRVAESLHSTYPDAILTIVADNDERPDRALNLGVRAATKAAVACNARLAIPPVPGDANDLAVSLGPDALIKLVASAAMVTNAAIYFMRHGEGNHVDRHSGRSEIDERCDVEDLARWRQRHCQG